MIADTVRGMLLCYPSVMIMKPEYGGGWCVDGRDMVAFFEDVAVATENYDTHENAGLRRQLVELLAVVKDLAEALIATTNTLEFADPNAPAVELANEVIEKHVKVIGPLIEEARRGGEK